MRVLLAVAVAAAVLLPLAVHAASDKVEGATLDAVTALATRGYKLPAAATVRNVHKSRAKNGLGYCGEVSVEAGGGFTVFHVIIAGKDSPASALRLSDYAEGDQSRNAIAVRRLMVNFGCIDPELPPAAEPDIR
jgi:hypothetical protein